ncbi:MAG: hypothetical protein AB7I27_08990 [Bacteriovoracaceae bacterium]
MSQDPKLISKYPYHDKKLKVRETPVKNSRIYLLTILRDLKYIHFFFLCRFGDWQNPQEDYYELTIPTGDSFKVTEENQGWKNNEYIFEKKGPANKDPSQPCRTYKVWNTPYATDTYCSGLALAEHEINPNHIFEYMIIGQDEWIEFFTRSEPKWTRIEKGTKIAELIAGYLKEWGPDEDDPKDPSA